MFSLLPLVIFCICFCKEHIQTIYGSLTEEQLMQHRVKLIHIVDTYLDVAVIFTD